MIDNDTIPPRCDLIETTLQKLLAPDQIVEIRVLGSRYGRGCVWCGFYEPDARHLVSDHLYDLSHERSVAIKGTYFTLNPLDSALLARRRNRLGIAQQGDGTADHNITSRRWLPLDFDPVRPAGISATKAELHQAAEMAARVRDCLRKIGWPSPATGGSGNGAHLLYRIALEREDDGLVQRLLEVLAIKFNTATIKLDSVNHNPSRIWKLYGTVAAKGDSTEDRPHRMSRLIHVPEPLGIVTRKLLEETLAELGGDEGEPEGKSQHGPSGSTRKTESNGVSPSASKKWNLADWIKQHGIECSSEGEWAAGGNGKGYRWVLSACLWNPDHTDSAFIVQLPTGAISAGCHHNSCAGKGWKELRALVEGKGFGDDEAGPAHSKNTQAAWQEPIPFGGHDLPPFPTDVLPPWQREFVEALATSTQTPPDLAAMLALSSIAIGVAGKVEVEAREGWKEPLNIFTVTALPPGNRKSSVFRKVMRPVFEHEKTLADAARTEAAQAGAELSIAEGRLRQIEQAAAKAEDAKERNRLMAEAVVLRSEMALMEPPPNPRLVSDDATPEALASLLAVHNGRMAVVSAEGGVFGMMAGRYSSTPNLDVYLKGHAGDALRVDRRGRPPEVVDHPCLTVALAVQPEVIRQLADGAGFRGRGLLARFLYALPRSPVGYRDVEPPTMPVALQTAYERDMLSLLAVPMPPTPWTLRLAPDAHRKLVAFCAWREPQFLPGEKLSGVADWAAKLEGVVVRLAGLLHLASLVDHSTPWKVPVPDVRVLEGVRIVREHLIPHALAAFDLMGVDDKTENAKHLLAWLRSKGKDTFTKREAHKANESRFRQAAQLDPALGILEERHYIRRIDPPSGSRRGRPPGPKFEVHPVLHTSDKKDNTDKKPAPGEEPSLSVQSALSVEGVSANTGSSCSADEAVLAPVDATTRMQENLSAEEPGSAPDETGSSQAEVDLEELDAVCAELFG